MRGKNAGYIAKVTSTSIEVKKWGRNSGSRYAGTFRITERSNGLPAEKVPYTQDGFIDLARYAYRDPTSNKLAIVKINMKGNHTSDFTDAKNALPFSLPSD